ARAGLNAAPHLRPALVGHFNGAALEHGVWSHKRLLDVVSHTPIECEKLNAIQSTGSWIDVMRSLVPEPTKLYTWWSYRSPDWAAADKGRRLDHIWVKPELGDRVRAMTVAKQARAWLRPSDHVPVGAARGDVRTAQGPPASGMPPSGSFPAVGAAELAAHLAHLAGGLLGARQQTVPQAERRVRIAFQHFEKQHPGNADHGRRLAGGRGHRPGALAE